MKLFYPSKQDAPFLLRAMKMIANASENGIGQHHLNLLNTAQKVLLKTNIDLNTIQEITPEKLGEQVKDKNIASQFVKGMVIMSIIDGPATPQQSKLIGSFASALQVDEPAVDVINHLANQEMLMFRLDFYRRSHLRDAIESLYRTQGGILGVVKGVLGLRGILENKELATRFNNLGKLPEATLGFAFYKHYKENKFKFPGEKGGFPISGAYHDFTHVLSGYSATPLGEILTGGFQAGYRRNENAFFIILFVVLTFSTGINVTPVDQDKSVGLLGEGDTAEKFFEAISRGSKMNIDLADDWDFWKYVELPLEEVRKEFGVLPLV